MINLSKAVDEINYDLMIDKLLSSSLQKIMVRTIGYMFKNRYAEVCFNNGKGEKLKMNKGPHQEGILSPLLLNLTMIECIEDIVNPLMPNGAFNICCPRDCVSRTANVERTVRH